MYRYYLELRIILELERVESTMVVCESGIKTQLYIEQCLNFMRFFNESTNDTLFLWDVAHGKITLGNNIDSNYIIGSSEDNTYNLKNLIRLI